MNTKITSYESGAEYLGINPELPEFPHLPEEHREAMKSLYRLVVINLAGQKEDNFKPDYHKLNKKYYPWPLVEAYKETPSGVGLSYYDDFYVLSSSLLGSRLVSASPKRARFNFETFKSDYESWHLMRDKKGEQP